ncbi:MAG: hypothetical protein OEY52_02310 [Gammaproteobacteria bacterium]|nr:hypothetical protein [Gammaproteobacteria bacterium]
MESRQAWIFLIFIVFFTVTVTGCGGSGGGGGAGPTSEEQTDTDTDPVPKEDPTPETPAPEEPAPKPEPTPDVPAPSPEPAPEPPAPAPPVEPAPEPPAPKPEPAPEPEPDPGLSISGIISGTEEPLRIQLSIFRPDMSMSVTSTSVSGSFLFTGVNPGDTYTLIIQQLPDGLSCTLRNQKGAVVDTDITDIAIECLPGGISRLYSNGDPANPADEMWNYYVASDGASYLDHSGAACDPVTDVGYDSCTHAGELKEVFVPSKSSCTGLTASDSIGAFDWECFADGDQIFFISRQLKPEKNLSDLIDFFAPGWKANSVHIFDNGVQFQVAAKNSWWANLVLIDNDGIAAGEAVDHTIYLVTENVDAAYTFDYQNNIGLVIRPGRHLQNTAAAQAAVNFYPGGNFVWVEGSIKADENTVSSNSVGLSLYGVLHSVIRNLTVLYSDTGQGYGIKLNQVNHSRLDRIILNQNISGLGISNSDNNSFRNISINGGLNGILLTGLNNSLESILLEHTDYGLRVGNGAGPVDSSGNQIENVNCRNCLTGFAVFQTAENNYLNKIKYNYQKYKNSLGTGIIMSGNSNVVSSAILSGGKTGIDLTGDSNTISDIAVSSIDSDSLHIRGNSNIISGALVTSSVNGVLLDGASNNLLQNMTLGNNRLGIKLVNVSSFNRFINILAANNMNGIHFNTDTGDNTSGSNIFQNLVLTGNDAGIVAGVSLANVFSGLFRVSENGSNCLGISGGITSSSGNCVAEGGSTFTQESVSGAGSILSGKVSITDSANASNLDGQLTMTDLDEPSLDWTSFSSKYRTWGRDGGLFPNGASREYLGCSTGLYRSKTECTSLGHTWYGDARIWDWSLLSSDTAARYALPTPDDSTYIHTWADATTSTVINNMVEIIGNGNGNENGLCEAGETCSILTSIGFHQPARRLIPLPLPPRP